jgi:O-succinylbenzoic acid--CoA ligase
MSSITCPLQYNAENLKKHVFIICGKKKITYEQFYQAVRSTAEYLKVLDLKEKTKVAIFAPNSVEYLIVLYALWRIGVITCLLNTRIPEENINTQLKEINAKHLITSIDSFLHSDAIDAQKISLQEIIKSNPSLKEEDEKFEFNLHQATTILFTSGSTDNPKAALHSFGNHFFSAKGSNENISVIPKDRWLLSLPLYHVGGLSIFFRILLGKGTIVIPSAEDNLFETMTKNKITHLSVVPTQLHRLIEKEENLETLEHLKAILVGGSAIAKSLLKKAMQWHLPIYITYGSTEMSSQIATSDKLIKEDNFRKAKLLNHRELKINEHEEILVKGPCLFQGYVKDDQVKSPIDDKGWFKTGDLGHVADRHYLTIYGRKDNMFISGGENIQPEEIERFLCETNEVEQAIVVPIENKEFGARPVAFIRAKKNIQLEKERFIEILQNNLPKYKIPEHFYVWPKEWEISGLKENRKRLSQLAQHNNPDLEIIN